MNQVRERVEEQVRRPPSDIAGDDRGAPGIAQGGAPGGESWDRHPVNFRFSIPLPFGRYYVTLVAGKERRGAERLTSERRKHPLLAFGNLTAVVTMRQES